jgi:hypothetical protein
MDTNLLAANASGTRKSSPVFLLSMMAATCSPSSF